MKNIQGRQNRQRFVLILLVACACIASACVDLTQTDADAPQPTAEGESAAEITWHSYDEGMQIAGEQNKPAMIDVYTSWCRYCKDLDRLVYPDPNVIRLADDFVCIKIDADKQRDLAAQYNPRGGVPVVIFLRSDGTEVHRLGGYPRGGPDAFAQEMMVALNNV